MTLDLVFFFFVCLFYLFLVAEFHTLCCFSGFDERPPAVPQAVRSTSLTRRILTKEKLRIAAMRLSASPEWMRYIVIIRFSLNYCFAGAWVVRF